MSYNSTGNFTAGTCANILKNLSDIQGDMHSPLMKQTALGYVEALQSPLNTAGRQVIPITDNDKRKQVRVKYLNRAIETQVDEAITRSCDTGDFDDFNEVTVDVTKEVELRWSVKEREFQKICDESQSQYVQTLLASKFNALAKKINRNILEDQLTNFGENKSTGTAAASTVTVFPDATGNINARPLQTMEFDYTVSNQSVGTPILIGGGLIYQYWKTLQAGCCNDGGVDMLALSNQLGFSPFLDTMVDSVIGANEFIVIEPSLTHFLQFNEYIGEREKLDSPFVANTTITDPRRNITYDMKILFDQCDDVWTFILRNTYDIFFQPLDAYHPDDELNGINGTLRYLAQTS